MAAQRKIGRGTFNSQSMFRHNIKRRRPLELSVSCDRDGGESSYI